MPSELIEITGRCKYARLFEHNRDPGTQKGVNGARYDYPEATSVDLYVEQDQFDVLTAAFPTYKPNPTEQGMLVKFKRTWVNEYNEDSGGTADIVDEENNPWDHKTPIGDDSLLTVFAEVYPSKAPLGFSMRMLGVKVLDHVPLAPPESPKLPWQK